MKTAIQLFAAIVMMAGLTTKGMAQTSDYSVDWSDTSTYKVTCGKVVPAQWSVKNQTCEMTTPHIRAEVAAGCKVNFNCRINQSGNGETNDICQIYHQIDNGDWVLVKVITGGAGSPSVHSISDSVYLDYGHFVQFKIRMTTNSQSEFWAVLEGDMAATDGNPTVNSLSLWSGEPPPPPSNLPVELIMFNGKEVNGVVELSWATASETNNNYFTIEKSNDIINYEILVNVVGAGNSNTLLNYSIKDNEPFSGVSYYRLKQTDFDGKYTYSNLVKVDFGKSLDVNIYPNPFNTSITITVNDASQTNNYKLRLYNVLGVEVMNTSITRQSTTLGTSILPSGIYSYKLVLSGVDGIFGDDKTIQSGKLISQQ